MKNASKYLSFVFAVFTMVICLPAHSAYQYTYTTTIPFDTFFQNTFTGDSEEANFTENDFIKLVITSENLLPVFPEYDPQRYLDVATFDFYAGDFKLRAAIEGNPQNVGETTFSSGLRLNEVDSNGLPTEWGFSAGQYTNLGNGYFETMSFEIRSAETVPDVIEIEEYASFYLKNNLVSGTGEIIAVGSGVWTLNEISSPVPEVSESAMFLVGLSLLGFIARRNTRV